MYKIYKNFDLLNGTIKVSLHYWVELNGQTPLPYLVPIHKLEAKWQAQRQHQKWGNNGMYPQKLVLHPVYTLQSNLAK
ncbi:hypothetical protein E2C01_029458 [Portunus trituberculatus]|uniref:Uncharacterized protein n=1 Tax=Portunus trituberculatus TaxID=210409 RepID=A0A5B7ERH8_PORTR|nr:hypothetical protein [Portunus trituberculatus]